MLLFLCYKDVVYIDEFEILSYNFVVFIYYIWYSLWYNIFVKVVEGMKVVLWVIDIDSIIYLF